MVLKIGTATITVDPGTGDTGEVPEDIDMGATATDPEDEFSMTGDSRGFFSDSATVQLDAKNAEITPAGYLKLSDITIAKVMVQTYQDSQGRTKKVLKSNDALRDMIEFGSGRPVTDEHPAGGVVMSRKDTRGYIENLYFTDNGEAKSDIYITCPHLIKKVQDGKKSEVSIGFYSNINNTPGVYNDQEYDEVQTDIWLDHLAIVKQGRCSRKDGCGITDSVKPKIKVVKVKDTKAIQSAPVKVIDSATVVAEKTRLINEIHLVADSDINDEELMKIDIPQLTIVKDMMQIRKQTFNLDGTKKESLDDVIERLQKD